MRIELMLGLFAVLLSVGALDMIILDDSSMSFCYMICSLWFYIICSFFYACSDQKDGWIIKASSDLLFSTYENGGNYWRKGC